eukprot:409827_1
MDHNFQLALHNQSTFNSLGEKRYKEIENDLLNHFGGTRNLFAMLLNDANHLTYHQHIDLSALLEPVGVLFGAAVDYIGADEELEQDPICLVLFLWLCMVFIGAFVGEIERETSVNATDTVNTLKTWHWMLFVISMAVSMMMNRWAEVINRMMTRILYFASSVLLFVVDNAWDYTGHLMKASNFIVLCCDEDTRPCIDTQTHFGCVIDEKKHFKGDGCVHLYIKEQFINYGSIASDGSLSSSGGSIVICCKLFINYGVIQCIGGKDIANKSGKGQHGRIAIYTKVFENYGKIIPASNLYIGSFEEGIQLFKKRQKNAAKW